MVLLLSSTLGVSMVFYFCLFLLFFFYLVLYLSSRRRIVSFFLCLASSSQTIIIIIIALPVVVYKQDGRSTDVLRHKTEDEIKRECSKKKPYEVSENTSKRNHANIITRSEEASSTTSVTKFFY